MKIFSGVLVALLGIMAWSQTGVTGQTTIHLLNGEFLCQGTARTVEVSVHTSGLSGNSGELANPVHRKRRRSSDRYGQH